MPLSKSRAIGTTVAVDVLILVALAFAVVGYVGDLNVLPPKLTR